MSREKTRESYEFEVDDKLLDEDGLPVVAAASSDSAVQVPPPVPLVTALLNRWNDIPHNRRSGLLIGLMTAIVIGSVVVLHFFPLEADPTSPNLPLILSTWGFIEATDTAWTVLMDGGSPLDAVESGINVCELDPQKCDNFAGYGGAPNEDGETTLDALIMDGTLGKSGAVGNLKKVSRAVSVARQVLEATKHTLLVGEDATRFAVRMGFPLRDLSTAASEAAWKEWIADGHQPNYWIGGHNYSTVDSPLSLDRMNHQFYMDAEDEVNAEAMARGEAFRAHGMPDHVVWSDEERVAFLTKMRARADRAQAEQSGTEVARASSSSSSSSLGGMTVGMITVDSKRNIAAAASTNGVAFKIPGRVGDGSLLGAGAYVDGEVGAAVATGDGDLMVNYLPAFRAVQNMARGMTPTEACENAIRYVREKTLNKATGALVCANVYGEYGAARTGSTRFYYSIRNARMAETKINYI